MSVVVRVLHFDVCLQVAFSLDGHSADGARQAHVGAAVLLQVLGQYFATGEGPLAQLARVRPEVCQVVPLEDGRLTEAFAADGAHVGTIFGVLGAVAPGQEGQQGRGVVGHGVLWVQRGVRRKTT